MTQTYTIHAANLLLAPGSASNYFRLGAALASGSLASLLRACQRISA